MRKRSVLSFALALAAAAPLASAQTHETYELAVPVAGDGRAQELNFPQFDPDRGQLLAVKIEYSTKAFGAARVENMDRSAATVSLLSTFGVAVHAFDGEILMLSSSDNLHVQRLDAFDGNLDYDGASGFQVPIEAATAVQSRAIEPQDAAFDEFIGRTAATLNASGLQINTAYGLNNGDVGSRMSFQLVMRLTYAYVPNGTPLQYDDFDDDNNAQEKRLSQQQQQQKRKAAQAAPSKAANQNAGSSGPKQSSQVRRPAPAKEKLIAVKRIALASRKYAAQQPSKP